MFHKNTFFQKKIRAYLVTPRHLPPRQAKTPIITPKFDTSRVMRSVRRAAKAGEVLVSLS